jgi:transposase
MAHRHELSDQQWERIKEFLPTRRGRPSKKGNRSFINAVLFWAKTGIPWRDLPKRYGPWKTVFSRFDRWAKRGVWEKLFKELQVDIDPDGSMADASIVRAHQHAAGGKGGRKTRL